MVEGDGEHNVAAVCPCHQVRERRMLLQQATIVNFASAVGFGTLGNFVEPCKFLGS